MSPENISNQKNENEELSLGNIDTDKIDYNDVESVSKYAFFAGNSVADRLAEDPSYLSEHNDIVDLVFRNVCVSFDRIKTGEDITGVPESNLKTINYYEQLMAGEASIYGKESKSGAFSLEAAVSDGDLPPSAASDVADYLKKSNELLQGIFLDPNTKVDPGLLQYISSNTIPVIEALKRQKE